MDLIDRQAVIDIIDANKNLDGNDAIVWIEKELAALPSVSTEKLDKAKSEIRYGESKAYNADFTMGCEYAISVIERMLEGAEE